MNKCKVQKSDNEYQNILCEINEISNLLKPQPKEELSMKGEATFIQFEPCYGGVLASLEYLKKEIKEFLQDVEINTTVVDINIDIEELKNKIVKELKDEFPKTINVTSIDIEELKNNKKKL